MEETLSFQSRKKRS